jgi:outer membrane receptor protein involved in Fe transport
VFGVAGEAHAAGARVAFRIDPKPYSEALLDVAQQANVTLIGAAACEGYFRGGLHAALTLEEALDRVLDGAACRWRMAGPGAVEISSPARETIRPAPMAVVSELLVTATKRVRDPRLLAVAVTAVDAESLKATGSSDIAAAAGQLAGVLATNLGPGRNKLLLRGLSDGAFTGRARSTVATYLDDIPINYNAPDPDLRLTDVDRVEVARGPQGALYGSGTLSGVYRIVTRKPELERFAGGARATGALTQGGDPSQALEGYLNVPVFDGVAALRLSAYEETQGGYIDDTNLGRANVDRTTRQGGRLTVLLQPTEDWSVHLTGALQHLRSDDTHYTAPGLGLKRANRIPEPHVNDITLATATIRKSWGWGDLTSSTGYVRHSYGSFYDATATQSLYTVRAVTSAYSERTRTRMLVEDLFLTSRGAGRVQWLAGVYGSITQEHSPTQFIVQNPPPDELVYGDDRHDRIREVALYGEASYEFAPRWTVAVGARAFSIHTRTRSNVVSERFLARSFDRETNFSSVSPKLTVQREFDDGDLVYAVISEGYRSGGINSGGAQALTKPRETFDPDRLRSYELGLKLQAFQRRLALDAAVFYDEWDDIQTDQFRATSGIPYTTNAGDAHILGLEAELAVRPVDGLIVQFNGRVSRTRTFRPNLDFAPLLVNGLPGAPAVSGGVLVTYDRDLASEMRLRLTGEANYVGRSRVTWDYSDVPKMGGYVRAKLTAELTVRNYGMQLFVTNPQNAYSDTFAFGNPFNFTGERQITPQRPRTLGLTVFADF